MEATFIRQSVPTKRMATVREISEGILFLASPVASYCNGTCLLIDGGYASETMPCGRFDVYVK
jgi:NAD(P)-dependent dehydrogenase (short-subunit alcohol dehydrogenase family)